MFLRIHRIGFMYMKPVIPQVSPEIFGSTKRVKEALPYAVIVNAFGNKYSE